jgi:hypothetical protein
MRRYWGGVAALAALLFLASLAHAQNSPEITRGVQWLSGQVQPSGALANEAASIASPFQSRTEAAETFKLFTSIPPTLANAIAAETDGSSEYLARKAVSLLLASRDASAPVNALLARQNADGGFGGQSGYQSNPLDTAFALIAFKAANQAAPLAKALAYLQSVQAADGSYSAPGRADVDVTANAAIALRLHASQFNVIAALQKAVAYLQSQRSPTTFWGDSVFLTSIAYDAVHDFIPLEPSATAVRNFLVGRQAADGSWDSGDPFSTALALRALRLTGLAPSNPTLAILKGRIVDAQTAQPLANVSVVLSGASNGTRTTAAGGTFEFRDLPAGNYNVQLTLAQYTPLNVASGAQPGQTQDLGTLQLSKGAAATTGIVRGTVRDASNNQPLAGATVTVAGAPGVVTDAAGAYQIVNVPAGAIVVQASRTSYASVSGSGDLAPGGVMIFSPSLAPGANNATATLTGLATRASNNAPLQGVTIAVSGASNAVATTGPDGRYSIPNVNAGLIQVQASLTGFDNVNGSVTVVGNSTVTFSPRMFATNTTPPDQSASSVSGASPSRARARRSS